MKKKITGNFGIDKCYFKYNSPFLVEKRVKLFNTLAVYSTSIREALKLKKTINILFVYSYLITNDGASIIAQTKFDGKKYATKFNFQETSRDNFFPQCMENTFVKY